MTLRITVYNTAVGIFLKTIQFISNIFLNFVYGGPNVPTIPIKEDCLLDSATNLAARIRTRKITSVEAVTACIRRLKEINPIINAIVANRFEEALKEAEAVDTFLLDESKTADDIKKDSPFLGVPFTFKDGIELKGHLQSYGSYNSKDRIGVEDAEVIALMKKAGAIPLASSNVPEKMMWWETNNRVYGITRNPYNSQHTAGGSSGGEAALIAATGSIMGIGSDLGGSIRIPAHMCGIFGHFPTRGVVPSKRTPSPRENISSLESYGPMSKFAKDLKPMLKVLSKNAKELRLDDSVDVKKLRYYYMDSDGGSLLRNGVSKVDIESKKAMKSVVEHFRRTHGIKVEKININEMKHSYNIWWSLLNSKEGIGMNYPGFLSVLLGLVRSTFAFALFGHLQKSAPMEGQRSHKHFSTLREELAKKLKDLLKDDAVLFYPTHPTAACKHFASLFRPFDFSYTAVFNAVEVAVTQCPITQTKDGLPIGIQIVAAPYQDRLSLAVAEELEEAFGGWKPPPSQPKWT